MLDTVLLVLLLLVVPGYRVARSWKASDRPAPPRRRRYLQTIALALALDAVLAAAWWKTGRTLLALGLDVPPTFAGLAGIAAAVCLLVVLAFAVRRNGGSAKGNATRVPEFLPENGQDLALFLAFAVSVGVSWEVLYRGYLMWSLRPELGTLGAIALASASYGLAHGVKSWKSLVASLISALVFTLAYAVSGSLWWLMILHAGLPLLPLLSPPKRLD